MKSFEHRNVLVLGAGRSGCAAAELLVGKGCSVCLVDGGGDDGGCDGLKDLGVEVRFDVEDVACCLGEATVAIVSPGFSWDHRWVEHCRLLSLELLSELELGCFYLEGRILAITGSLGKSTCTALSTYALNHSGVKAVAGGNFGTPVCELAMCHADADWFVLEVSSFQLECFRYFKPDVALLMNVYANHLDRHKTMARYVGLKMRIFENMGGGDTALFPDALAHELLWMVPRSVNRKTFGVDRGDVTWMKQAVRLPFDLSPVLGAWPKANVVGWFAVMQACGVSFGVLEQAVQAFKGLPHRMEVLLPVGGVGVVNDSKSTCLAATRGAVESCSGVLHLIMGGRAKGEDDLSLKEVLEARKVHVYLIGESADFWYAAWSKTIRCRVCRTLDVAVEDSLSAACHGETVILSPGCASFDQYESFEMRGKAFKENIEQWKKALASEEVAG